MYQGSFRVGTTALRGLLRTGPTGKMSALRSGYPCIDLLLAS